MPLYQGGALDSREREAAALALKTRDDLENVKRTAATTTRQNYLIVINGIAAIAALEQALISSQSSLDSNKLGYEVGVRINIDVLNAQQQLFSTRRDLLVARYNTILTQLPEGTDPPIVDKFDIDAAPILTLAISGRRDMREVTEIAKKQIKEDLETLPGVGAVYPNGSPAQKASGYVTARRVLTRTTNFGRMP